MKKGLSMATIEKRTSSEGKVSYRVKIRIKGFPDQTATFTKLSMAKDWIARTETKIKDGKYFSEIQARKYTVSEIIERYKKTVLIHKKSIQSDWTSQLNWWNEKIGKYTLADVSPALISQMRDILTQEPGVKGKLRSNATVNRYLTTLQCVFSKAVVEWELLEVNPFFRVKKLQEPKGRVRYLTKEERQALLAECQNAKNSYLYPVVVVALSTGARKMEVLGLKWEDVDLQNERAILQDTKNGERRTLNLMGEVKQLIENLYANRRKSDVYVFPSQDGKKPFDITRSWKAAVKRAGIKDFRFHDLRHTTASYLAMQGKSSGELAEVLGHKTLQMVKRYAHLSDAHKKMLTADMNKAIFGE